MRCAARSACCSRAFRGGPRTCGRALFSVERAADVVSFPVSPRSALDTITAAVAEAYGCPVVTGDFAGIEVLNPVRVVQSARRSTSIDRKWPRGSGLSGARFAFAKWCARPHLRMAV